MDEESRKKLQAWAEGFARTEPGRWLNDFNWKSIPVEWSDRCNAANGVLGMYSMGRICLMEASAAPDMIFPTYIHELYHCCQWLTCPAKYLLGKVIRPLIEVPADEMTDAAEEWIDRVMSDLSDQSDQSDLSGEETEP